ncbi:hypothetical protein BpHYR1_029725 [Brachionus plicatilis]|uniref:Apolipo L3-like n=1 Tax=Brachionus plicatilis TaxID=10195 RepID=A0A3M7QQ21_BRAPC|nr:hypothetical protein BpHYR1_029725 [Brachionus plicatilis]
MEILQEFILKTEEAINLLEIKKKEIEQPLERIHQNSNVARTVGTSVSTAGAGLFVGALLLAPFTGGISIVAASGLGAACGIGGAVVNIGTEVADHFASKDCLPFTNQIKDKIEERNRIGEKLNKCFENFENIFKKLVEEEMNEDDAFIRAIFLVFRIGINKNKEQFEYFRNIFKKLVEEGMNEDDAFTKAILLVFQRGITSANLLRIHNINSIAGAGSGIKFAINSGGQIWRSMRVQSLAMRKVLSSLGVNVSRKAAMTFIRRGTFCLSTVFIYFDLKSLIECWKSKHPNMAQVEEIIKKFKEELVNFKELNKWLIESSM